MAQITWRNVDAPDLSSTLGAYSRMGEGVANAFDRLGNVFIKRNEDAKAKYNNELMGQVMLAQDPAALNALRGKILGDNAWQLNKALVGKTLTDQFGTLQDQSIKQENILDDQALRDSGEAIARSTQGSYDTGRMSFDGISTRILGAQAPGLLSAADRGRGADLQDSEFGFRKSEALIDNRRADAQLQLQRQEANARAQERREAKAPQLSYNGGAGIVDNLLKNGTFTQAGLVKAVSDESVKAGDNATTAKFRMQGALDRFSAISNPQAVNLDPDTAKMVGNIGESARMATLDLEKNKSQGVRANGGFLLPAFTPKDLTAAPGEALGRYKGDKDDLGEVKEWMGKYSQLPPAIVVEVANLNSGSAFGGLSSREMKKALDDVQAKFNSGAFEDMSYTADNFDRKIGNVELNKQALLAEIRAYNAVDAPLPPDLQIRLDKAEAPARDRDNALLANLAAEEQKFEDNRRKQEAAAAALQKDLARYGKSRSTRGF